MNFLIILVKAILSGTVATIWCVDTMIFWPTM